MVSKSDVVVYGGAVILIGIVGYELYRGLNAAGGDIQKAFGNLGNWFGSFGSSITKPLTNASKTLTSGVNLVVTRTTDLGNSFVAPQQQGNPFVGLGQFFFGTTKVPTKAELFQQKFGNPNLGNTPSNALTPTQASEVPNMYLFGQYTQVPASSGGGTYSVGAYP